MQTFRLQAHSQPITKVRFNRDGDLLFVSCKDKLISVWYTENGEILGSYKARHAVVDCDVSYDSKYLAAVTAGGYFVVYDVKTGVTLQEMDVSKYRVTSVQFHPFQHKLLVTVPYTRDEPTTVLRLMSLFEKDRKLLIKDDTRVSLTSQNESFLIGCWGPDGKTILVGCRDGSVKLYGVQAMNKALNTRDALIKSTKVHESEVEDIVLSKDGAFFLTSSGDQTAKLLNSETLEITKVYKTDEPLNTAAISPLKNQIMVGGGTRAQEVTTSFRKRETFDTIFHHLVFEKEIGVVKGHFGPINCLRFSPDGKMFASGGEDSVTKLYKFNQSYIDQKDDANHFLQNYVV